MTLHRDERGLITAWLVKLLVGFAVTAIVLYDAGSIAVNFFTLDSTADDIAVALIPSGGRLEPSDIAEISKDAAALAAQSNAKLLDLDIEQDGIVRIKIRRRADTLVVKRIGFMRDWTRATAEGQAGSI